MSNTASHFSSYIAYFLVYAGFYFYLSFKFGDIHTKNDKVSVEKHVNVKKIHLIESSQVSVRTEQISTIGYATSISTSPAPVSTSSVGLSRVKTSDSTTISDINSCYSESSYSSKITSANQEIKSCGLGLIDCKDFTISKSNLVHIPVETYRKVILNEFDQTDAKMTKVTISADSCEQGGFIGLKIEPKTSMGKSKEYGGDYFLARLTKFKEGPIKEGPMKNGSNKKLSNTVIPIELITTKNRKNYTIYTGEIPCFLPGNFKLTVNLIRSSETQELVRRVMAGYHQKSRIFQCWLRGSEQPQQCGSGVSFLKKAEMMNFSVCATNKVPGREFYVKTRGKFDLDFKNLEKIEDCKRFLKEGFVESKDSFLDVLKKGGVSLLSERQFEKLVYKNFIEVKKRVDPEQHSPVTKGLKGYYDDSNGELKWVTHKLQKKSLIETVRNKIVVISSDSLGRQIWEGIIKNRDYITQGNCKKVATWDFLGLNEFHKICSAKGYWEPQKHYCSKTNTTVYYSLHGPPYHTSHLTKCASMLHYSSEILERMIENEWVGSEYRVVLQKNVRKMFVSG